MPNYYTSFTVPSEVMAFRQTFWVENIRACLIDIKHLEYYLDFYIQNTIDAIQLNPREAINAQLDNKIDPRHFIEQIKQDARFAQYAENHPAKLLVSALEILISDVDVNQKRDVLANVYQQIAPQILADPDKDILADYAGLAGYSHMPALIALIESLDNTQYVFNKRLIFARHLLNHLLGIALQVFDTEEERQNILSDFAKGDFESVKVAIAKVKKRDGCLRPGLENLITLLLDAKDAVELRDKIKEKLPELQKFVFYQAGKDLVRNGLTITDKAMGTKKYLKFAYGNGPKVIEQISDKIVMETIYLDVPESAYDKVALAIAQHLHTEYQFSNQFIAYLFSSCHQMAYNNIPMGIQRYFPLNHGELRYEPNKISYEVTVGADKRPERVLHALKYVKKHPDTRERPPFAEIQVIQHTHPRNFVGNEALTEYLPGTFAEEDISISYQAFDYNAVLKLPKNAILQHAISVMRITKENIAQQVIELRENLKAARLIYLPNRDQFDNEFDNDEPGDIAKLLKQFKNVDRSSLDEFVRESDALIDELQQRYGDELNSLVAQYYEPVNDTEKDILRHTHPDKSDEELTAILSQRKQRNFAEVFKLSFHVGGHVSDGGMSGFMRTDAEHRFVRVILERADNPVLCRYLGAIADQRANLAAVITGIDALSSFDQNQSDVELRAITLLSPLFTAMRDLNKVSSQMMSERYHFFVDSQQSYNPLRYIKKHPIRAGLFFIGGIFLIAAGLVAWPFATALLTGAGIVGAGIAVVSFITGLTIPVLAGASVGVFFGGILTSLLASAFGMSKVEQPVPPFVPATGPNVATPLPETLKMQISETARIRQTVEEKQLAEIIAYIKIHASEDLVMVPVHRLFNLPYDVLIEELKETLLSLEQSRKYIGYTKLVDIFEDLLKGDNLNPNRDVFINMIENVIHGSDELKKIKELSASSYKPQLRIGEESPIASPPTSPRGEPELHLFDMRREGKAWKKDKQADTSGEKEKADASARAEMQSDLTNKPHH